MSNDLLISNKDVENKSFHLRDVLNPVWLSISESAKISGINSKTIRRAIKSKEIKYKVIGNRYTVDFQSLVEFLYSKTKLRNKLSQSGIGQYIDKWRQ